MSEKKLKTDHHKGVFSLFGYRSNPKTPLMFGVAVSSAGLYLGGCGSNETRDDERNSDYYNDQSSAVFGSGDGSMQSRSPAHILLNNSVQDEDVTQQQSTGSDPLVGGWSIILTKLNGAGMKRAEELLRIIQTETPLRQAFIEKRAEGLVIAYGNYMGREAAQTDLGRIKQTQMLSSKPFENAIIAPPSSNELRGSNPMFDLRTVKQRYGKQAVYTLQIGIYGRVDYQPPTAEELAAYRKAAEQAVVELRSKGETAFYYHAPSRSMVTVGVFGEDDFDSTVLPPYQSPMLKVTRERFPNNLLNGQGISEKVRTETGHLTQMQSSQLVAIPEK